MNKKIFLLLLGLSFVCILIMELGMVIGGDELSYAYAGQHSSVLENPPRVQCFMDIVRQQIGDYNFRGNGRVIIHSVIAFLSWKHLLIPYRVTTAFVWFLFVWLILKESKVKPLSVQTFFYGSLFVYWFFWYSETAACNACFSGNYLFPACITICMMHLWKRSTSKWLIPCSLIFGLLQETYVLPFLGAMALTTGYRFVIMKKHEINWIKVSSWCLMLVGASFLCLGPASRSRASQVGGSFGVGTIQGIGHAMLIGTPAILLLLLAYIICRHRKDFKSWLENNLEWCMYFVCAFGLWIMVVKDVYLRTGASWFMSAIILLVTNRAAFSIGRTARVTLSGIVLSWMVIAAFLQGTIGLKSYQMLKLYKDDAQGVTKYDSISCGPFFYTCNDPLLVSWYLKFYRLEYGDGVKPTPVVLSEGLYNSLYLDSSSFFKNAKLIGDDLYVDAENSRVVVCKGKAEPSSKQRKAVTDYFARRKDSKWLRYLPGRFALMYHPNGSYVSLPKTPYHVCTKDGESVWLITK